MNRLFKVFFILSAIIVWVTASGFAFPNWVTTEEKPTAVYQFDTESVRFSGEDTDKQLEVWMKTLSKDGTGSYLLAHYLVKENGMQFILKDRTFYSANGVATSSFQNKSDKWNATTPDTPIGSIATRLFAEYRKNPESFNSKTLINNPEEQGALSAKNKEASLNMEVTEIAVDPNEVKKALDDEQIKKDTNDDGTRIFYVRDKRGPALFSGIFHYVTADFCLSIDTNNKRSAILKFSTEDTRSGAHQEKEAITIQIDGKNWVLSPPLNSDSSGRNSVKFKYAFNLPNSLIQALVATKTPVTIKWMHRYNNYWEDHERIIPDNKLRAIQLMYIGCK